MSFNKSDYKDLTFNGYVWRGFVDGFHMFTKQINGKWALIECVTDQIKNGDLEFMSTHGLTVDKKIWKGDI